MEKTKIIALFVEDIGWVYPKDVPVEVFQVNGEMALVTWYRIGNEEYNGRYVEYIRYE